MGRTSGRTRQAAATVVTTSLGLLLVFGASGCATVKEYVVQLRPTAHIVGVGFEDITLKSLTLTLDVEMENPYGVDLPLAGVDYSLACQNEPFLSGDKHVEGVVPSRSARTIRLPLDIQYKALMEAVSAVRPGQVVPYTVQLGVSVDSAALGRLRLPLTKHGQLPIPQAPRLKVRHVQWKSLTLDEAIGHVELDVTNPSQFALKLARMEYSLALGGVPVAASSLAQAIDFGANGGSATVAIPIALSPKRLGMAAFRMLTGRGSGYQLRATLNVDTPYGPMTLPIDVSGETEFRK